MIVLCTVYITALLQVAGGLEWTSNSPDNGQVIHVCVGGNATITWGYTLGPHDIVTSSKWIFQGLSEEMVALSVAGTFVPLPAFGNRVTHVPEAGLTLSHVTDADRGNYSVEVVGHNGAGTTFSVRRVVTLQVADDLMTTDNRLHVSIQPTAEYSNDSDQWHAVLTCGHFTYLEDPPYSMEWMTPDGRILPSQDYTNGVFRLLVPNPVIPGNYTCHIPETSLRDACTHGQTKEASVAVDGLETRMTLMEARQAALEAENTALRASVSDLRREKENLTAVLQGSKQEATRQVAFNAHLQSVTNMGYQDRIVFNTVFLNEGNAYDPSTGVFVAPVNGTYYFSAFAAPHNSDTHVHIAVMLGSQYLCTAEASNGEDFSYQSASCQASVHLNRGQSVWILNHVSNATYASVSPTGFTGFLLFDDAN